MNLLNGPRGIIAFDEDKKVLERTLAQWPEPERARLHITEHKAQDKKNSSRRARRAENA